MRLLFVFVFLLGLVSCGEEKKSSSSSSSDSSNDNKKNCDNIEGVIDCDFNPRSSNFEETLKKYNKDEVKIKCCENGIIKHTYTVRKEEYRDGKFGFSAAKICYDEKGRQTRCEENGNQTYP